MKFKKSSKKKIIKLSRKLDTRQDRYDTDIEFRKRQRKFSRNYYRKKNATQFENCLVSLDFLDKLGSERRVETSTGHVFTSITFNIAELALALQKPYNTIWHWIDDKKLPKPKLTEIAHTPKMLYDIDEARVIIDEVGHHEMNFRYFRKDHDEVIDAINSRISEVRKQLNQR